MNINNTATKLSQLSAGNIMLAGGSIEISSSLFHVLRGHGHSASDTDDRFYRETDSAELVVDLNASKKPKVRMLYGALTTANNDALCVVERKKGAVRPVYRIRELIVYGETETGVQNRFTGREIANLVELNKLTGLTFCNK